MRVFRLIITIFILLTSFFILPIPAQAACSNFSDNFNRATLGPNWVVYRAFPSTSTISIEGNTQLLHAHDSLGTAASVGARLNKQFTGDVRIEEQLISTSTTETPDTDVIYTSNNFRILVADKLFEFNVRVFTPSKINLAVNYQNAASTFKVFYSHDLTSLPSPFKVKFERIGKIFKIYWGNNKNPVYTIPDFPTDAITFINYISINIPNADKTKTAPATRSKFDNLNITCIPKVTATAKPTETLLPTGTETPTTSPTITIIPTISITSTPSQETSYENNLRFVLICCCCPILFLILLLLIFIFADRSEMDKDIKTKLKRRFKEIKSKIGQG